MYETSTCISKDFVSLWSIVFHPPRLASVIYSKHRLDNSCHVLTFVRSCPVLPCPVLSCPILPSPIRSCRWLFLGMWVVVCGGVVDGVGVVFRLNGSEATGIQELFVTGEATPFYLASRNACMHIRKLVSSGYNLVCVFLRIEHCTPSCALSKRCPACSRAVCVP